MIWQMEIDQGIERTVMNWQEKMFASLRASAD